MGRVTGPGRCGTVPYAAEVNLGNCRPAGPGAAPWGAGALSPRSCLSCAGEGFAKSPIFPQPVCNGASNSLPLPGK